MNVWTKSRRFAVRFPEKFNACKKSNDVQETPLVSLLQSSLSGTIDKLKPWGKKPQTN